MAPTLKEIAARCGVSVRTVSCVLNGKARAARISDARSGHIVDTARRLGYRKNRLATTVRTGVNQAVAVLLPPHNAEYLLGILAGVNRRAQAAGYTVKMLRGDASQWSERELADELAGLMIPGLISIGRYGHDPDELRRRLAENNIRLVHAGILEGYDQVAQCAGDDAAGAGMAVEKLYGLGHRRIGICDSAGSPFDPKPAAFRRRAAELGAGNIVDFRLRHFGCNDLDGRAIGETLTREKPTAVFAVSDIVAMLFLQYARRAGFRVPEDVSVLGYADLACACWVQPHLSTFAVDWETVGGECVGMLVDAIGNDGDPAGKRVIPIRYVERDSVRPLRMGE